MRIGELRASCLGAGSGRGVGIKVVEGLCCAFGVHHSVVQDFCGVSCPNERDESVELGVVTGNVEGGDAIGSTDYGAVTLIIGLATRRDWRRGVEGLDGFVIPNEHFWIAGLDLFEENEAHCVVSAVRLIP